MEKKVTYGFFGIGLFLAFALGMHLIEELVSAPWADSAFFWAVIVVVIAVCIVKHFTKKDKDKDEEASSDSKKANEKTAKETVAEPYVPAVIRRNRQKTEDFDVPTVFRRNRQASLPKPVENNGNAEIFI